MTAHPTVELAAAQVLAAGRLARRRTVFIAGSLTFVLLVVLVLSVTLGGSASISLSDTLLAAAGRGDGLADFVVFENRVPRSLTAVLAGALFGLSGVVYQRLVMNVLATPDIIGVTAGAAAGGVVVLVLLERSGVATQVGALAGAFIAVTFIIALSAGGSAVVHRLVLVGIGISACFASVTNYVLAQADETGTERAMRWLVGSLHGAVWDDVRVLAVALTLSVVLLVLLVRDLDNLRLGDDIATSLGSRVRSTRRGVLLVGAAMAAVSTSVVGPVAFIALVCGPIAARLDPRGGIFVPGLMGAILLLASDVAAQNAPLISPVPTGAITALIGAPVLVVLLVRRKASIR